MAEVGSTRSNSQLLLVLGAGVLMLASGAGAYLVVRSPESGSNANPPTATVSTPTGDTVAGGGTASTTPGAATTVPEIVGFTLDAPSFSLVLPSLPEESQESSTSGAATVPATRWTLATGTDRLVVYTADYSQVVAAGGFDVQKLFDSILAAGASVAGATMPTNESITIGTDLARRAAINVGGAWTYLTLIWHGNTLLVIVAETTAAEAPTAYTTAIDSLVWKA